MGKFYSNILVVNTALFLGICVVLVRNYLKSMPSALPISKVTPSMQIVETPLAMQWFVGCCWFYSPVFQDDAVRDKKKNELDSYFQKLCRIMDDYLRCCRPFVINECGQDAWRLVSQVKELY